MKKTLQLLLIVFTISMQGQNKIFSSLGEYFDVSSSSWQNSGGTNYEYDSNNNLLLETQLQWTNGQWENSYKDLYTYNASNRITQRVSQTWNSTTNTFVNSARDAYTYINGKPSEIVYSEWVGSNWVLFEKTDITYNSNNNINGALFYLWNGTQWVIASRYTPTYNANNKLIEGVNQKWINSTWVNEYKQLYTYNANNKLITVRYAEWNVFNSIWVEYEREDYVLDANGNRLSTTYIDGSENYREINNYDLSSMMSSFAHPFKDKTGIDYFGEDFPYVNKVLGVNEFEFNTSTNSYVPSFRETYNYNSAISLNTEIIEIIDNSIIVYPNPTKDVLFIKSSSNASFDKITVIDLTGKKILEQNNSNNIDVQNLAKGMYIIQVLSGGSKLTNKFIKQ